MSQRFPRQEDQSAQERASALKILADEVYSWVDELSRQAADNPQVVSIIGKCFPVLGLQKCVAGKLEAAAKRPMTVAFFGQSQSGKSNVVSELGRTADSIFAILVGDSSSQPIDFLENIDPGGGKESTGVVTRFTTSQYNPPPDFPFNLELLSTADLVKIFLTGYALECAKPEERPDLGEIQKDFPESQGKFSANPLVTTEETFEIEDYISRHLRQGGEYFSILKEMGYWRFFREHVVYCPLKAQLKYLSLLWGEVDSLTDLFFNLVANLRSLGAPVVWAEQAALLPRGISVLNVETVKRYIRKKEDEKIRVVDAAGTIYKLPRSRLAALTAELILYVPQKPENHFLNKADILDFPGARGTGSGYTPEQLSRIPQVHDEVDAVAEFFLRGKLCYLFQRYLELRDITSLVLCSGPENIDALSMPPLITKWIHQSHGSSPKERTGKDVTLFTVFTKFDLSVTKTPQRNSPDDPERWMNRLDAHFSQVFGKHADNWVLNWDGSGAFSNCYWVRNPKIENPYFSYNESSGTETYSDEHAQEWLNQVSRHYYHNEHVKRHFASVGVKESWDAVGLPGNTGIDMLMRNLETRLKPEQKRAIITLEIQRVIDELKAALEPFLGSEQDELRQRAEKYVSEFLGATKKAKRFGTLLESFHISESEVAKIYSDTVKEIPDTGSVAAGKGNGGTGGDDWDDWGDDDWDADVTRTAHQKTDNTANSPESNEQPMSDSGQFELPHARYVKRVLYRWESVLNQAASDANLSQKTGLSQDWLATITTEMTKAASQSGLESELEKHARSTINDMNPLQKSGISAFVTSLMINNFVNYLQVAPLSVMDRLSGANPKVSGTAYPGKSYCRWWAARLESLLMNQPPGGADPIFDKAREELKRMVSENELLA